MNRITVGMIGGVLGIAAVQAQASVCSGYATGAEVWAEGDTVCFVYDPADIDPLYGTPSVSGDNIFVTPTDFFVESNDLQGTQWVGGVGTVQIIAKPGYVLDGITFGEVGDYVLNGSTASVDVLPWLRVFEWGAVPALGKEETMNVPVTGDLTLNDGLKHDWSATGGFDLTTPYWDGINRVGFTLQNDLKAFSNSVGDSARVAKKAIGAGITVSTSPVVVPVPAAVWLFGSGLIGLVGVARRRRG